MILDCDFNSRVEDDRKFDFLLMGLVSAVSCVVCMDLLETCTFLSVFPFLFVKSSLELAERESVCW